MTREEAIAYFEERRNYNPHNGNPAAERLAIEALRTQQELESKLRVLESNEPLTLDELRQMGGEPVWILCIGNDYWDEIWDVICFCNSEFLRAYRSGFLLLAEYGKSWMAYRQKPGEAVRA